MRHIALGITSTEPTSRCSATTALLLGAPGVENEEAVDDEVVEALELLGVGLDVWGGARGGAVGRELDGRPRVVAGRLAVGEEDGAVHLLVKAAQVDDAPVATVRFLDEATDLGEALVGDDRAEKRER